MSSIRDRAKEHLPVVLLTLLSIVQALALELLWSNIVASEYLFRLDWTALLHWLQAITSFLGIVVIWLVYASTAIRFRWVPSTSDSIYPFVIGILEFILIETQSPEFFGLWFVCLGLIVGAMTWVSHATMRRARHDGENAEFFSRYQPATLRDFFPALQMIAALIGIGAYLQLSGDRGVVALLAGLGAAAAITWQLLVTARFWDISIAPPDDD